MRPRFREAPTALAGDLVEEEIGKREVGKRRRVTKDAKEAVVAGIEALLAVMHQLTTHLQRVAALEPRQLFVELIGLVDGIRVARSRPDSRQTAAPPDRAQAGDRLARGGSAPGLWV